MRVLLAFVVAASSVVSVTALRINGWYPCGHSSKGDAPLDAVVQAFQCAEVGVPLCYQGICESNRTISLFVKRLPATAPNIHKPKAMWVLQGGPGFSSSAMENPMVTIYNHTQGTVSMYTVDHRGTGRSFFLQCDAAQGFVGGSPDGAQLSIMETPNCLRDVLFQIDYQTAAFSVTSAAKDMELLVNELNTEDEDVYVYGASYGTYWAERLMHLAPQRVKGYILDGVVAEDSPSFSTTSSDMIEAAKQLATYCTAESRCAAMFSNMIGRDLDLYSTWKAMLQSFDGLYLGQNPCVNRLNYSFPAKQLSDSVKSWLNTVRQKSGGVFLLPGLLKLVHRCQPNDLTAISEMLIESGVDEVSAPGGVYDQIEDESPILSGLIIVSEMWVEPSPSWEDEVGTAAQSVFSLPLSLDFANICIFSADASHPACGALKEMTNLTIKELNPVPFKYKPDQYHTKIATIPDHASVMVINGKLDFNTIRAYGVHQYEAMQGGRGKMMVDFPFGPHCAGTIPTSDDDHTECGPRIIASYLLNNGDTKSVNTSCLDEGPTHFLRTHLLTADDLVRQYVEIPAQQYGPYTTHA